MSMMLDEYMGWADDTPEKCLDYRFDTETRKIYARLKQSKEPKKIKELPMPKFTGYWGSLVQLYVVED